MLDEEHQGDARSSKAFDDYLTRRDRILEDDDAKKTIQKIAEGFEKGRLEGAFNALCVPSGTGKTQLAFCLQNYFEVVYLNMAANENATDQQSIYSNFNSYMSFLLRKLEIDFKSLGDIDPTL